MRPLVSVMMPCYNAAPTLPWALASLVAQTYTNWECLLVDDGSTDRPLDVADRLGDSRIKPIRLDRNRGRGAARQEAVDRASGDLLCMLDADDWLYPTKIERQVEAMRRTPDVALVGTGMAIVDRRNDLVGIRCRGAAGGLRVHGPMTRLSAPPVAFGPSMMRMGPAKQIRFDPRIATSEDIDFLIHFLMSQPYALLADVSYVYSEYTSATLEKIVRTLRFIRRIYGKHRDCFPIESRWNMGKAVAKEFVYRGAFALGLERRLIERRSASPTEIDIGEFLTARRVVASVVSRLFPGAGSSPAPNTEISRPLEKTRT